MSDFLKENLFWIRKPENAIVHTQKVEIFTEPETDLWQRTYYQFQNDSAPVLQTTTDSSFFLSSQKQNLKVNAALISVALYFILDSENWLKASVEYENEEYQRLGSVVTNHGYSDWATTDISASVRTMWYRLSRRESDYCIEYSTDGKSSNKCEYVI